MLSHMLAILHLPLFPRCFRSPHWSVDKECFKVSISLHSEPLKPFDWIIGKRHQVRKKDANITTPWNRPEDSNIYTSVKFLEIKYTTDKDKIQEAGKVKA